MMSTAAATRAGASRMTGIDSMFGTHTIEPGVHKPAATPARPASGRHSASALAHLHFLRARLAIFLYRHPLDNNAHIMDVIDNTESSAEIKLLLDYVLEQRAGRLGLPWTDHASA